MQYLVTHFDLNRSSSYHTWIGLQVTLEDLFRLKRVSIKITFWSRTLADFDYYVKFFNRSLISYQSFFAFACQENMEYKIACCVHGYLVYCEIWRTAVGRVLACETGGMLQTGTLRLWWYWKLKHTPLGSGNSKFVTWLKVSRKSHMTTAKCMLHV